MFSSSLSKPLLGRNGFSIIDPSTVVPAPFDLATCYSPSNQGTLFRSYKIYCSFSAIPAEFQSLPVVSDLSPERIAQFVPAK